MPLTASQRDIPLTEGRSNSQGYEYSESSKGHSSSPNGLELVETARIYVTNFASRIWGSVSMDTLRPLPVFVGVTGNNFCMSADAFTPPVKKMDKATPEKVTSRIKLNFSYFLTNYALVAFGVAVVVALMHPGMLISLSIVYALWYGHHYLISNEVILFNKNIGGLVSIAHRFYALFIITVVVVFWKCLKPAITFLVITSLIILFHAIMRDPKHIDKYGNADVRSGAADSDDEEEENNGSGVMVDRPENQV